MNREHTKKLLEDFPLLYEGVNKPITENLMKFGFSCGDGWFDLIYKLSKDIMEISNDCRTIQVKEKFGGLRFYTVFDGPDENDYSKINDLINKAEDESYEICESCGTKENVTTNGDGWIFTLCDSCRNLRNNDHDSFSRKLAGVETKTYIVRYQDTREIEVEATNELEAMRIIELCDNDNHLQGSVLCGSEVLSAKLKEN